MLKNACSWQRTPEKEKGIIIGCDCNQEWLLEWWWERYSAENAFPVAFIDFGMTEAAKQWCAERGDVIALSIDFSFLKPKEDDFPDSLNYEKVWGPELWKEMYGAFLPIERLNWFKKPFACLQSPYKTTIWFDLDCEILGAIDDLFSVCSAEHPLALMSEYETRHFQRYPGMFYNGGVIVFTHGSQIMCQWAQGVIERSSFFWSDDNLLSALIYELQFSVIELPEVYNWKLIWGANMNAIIYHWVGSAKGKNFIKKNRGMQAYPPEFLFEYHRYKS